MAARSLSKDPVRDTLQANWIEIMNNLEPSATLIGECFTCNLITRDQKQRIAKKETTSDMNGVLLDHAYGCWNAEYLLKFCQILESHMATNPDGHRRIVEKIYTTYEGKSGKSLRSACGNSSKDVKVKSLLSEAVLDLKPSQSDMLEIVPMMSSEWRKVGLHLKIKVYILDNISKNQRDKVEDCCLQMCREWLEKKKGTGEVERNWRSLLDCVEKVYGPESRRDIEKELKEMLASSKS
jgi:hypothetical protein